MKNQRLGWKRTGMVEPATHRTHYFAHRYDRGRDIKHGNVMTVKSILKDAVTIDVKYQEVSF